MAKSLSFSFTKFQSNEPDLIFQADALVTSDGKLQLTSILQGQPLAYSIGRVLFASPIHIWDSTGKVASFKTSFSFVISAPNLSNTADGLAFFLAPVDTQPQEDGGYLGIFSADNSEQVVAVEFDTFQNPWDPQGTHIGIDVNSIQSEKTKPWNLENDQVANVEITYEASNKVLAATLVYPNSPTPILYKIHQSVDLSIVLPEFVRVGFSAASGMSPSYVESHDVLSWSFESKFA